MHTSAKFEGRAKKKSSAKDRLIINSIRFALEAASLQWMEGEKELSMRTPMSLTTFATWNCLDFQWHGIIEVEEPVQKRCS